MEDLTLGVVGTSRKENEHRVPIHPAHLERIDTGLRSRIVLERGYGERFGVPDTDLARMVGGLRPRKALFDECDAVALAKPLAEDLDQMRPGQVLWGWPHAVQNYDIAQHAIDRRLTLIAWESMNHWTRDGHFSLHVFHRNNEIAGYSAVLHALALVGRTGSFGRRLRAVVISFGATARGAVSALFGLGIHDVTVLTHRSVPMVAAPMAPARLVHYERDPAHAHRTLAVTSQGGFSSLAGVLAEHDIIVNCVLQNTDDPVVFVTDDELDRFAPGTLFVDVSCDEGMGFSWARPTTFADPIFTVGQGIGYYAVDHTPSYLWDSASWEISDALIPHLPAVMAGPDGWQANETIRRAIEIRDGVVVNPAILSFQNRAPAFPHDRR